MSEADLIITVGDDVVIDLESNPTTGYEWHLQPSTLFTIENQEFKQFEDKSHRLGRGGKTIFTLRANEIGQETLNFSYYRSWEDPSKAVRSYIVTIKIEET